MKHKDVIIHLSNEEDKLDLLVKDYETKGTKIMHDYDHSRVLKTDQVQRELNVRGKQIANFYREMGQFIALSPSTSSMSEFESAWSKEQAQIRKSISIFSAHI
jgi:hypothetical protein